MAPRISMPMVYSATGTAFAAAADDTASPRSKMTGARIFLTDPAAWMQARRFTVLIV